MRMTLESTTRTVTVNGVPARVWEGRTEKGVEVFALITRVAAHESADCAEFESDLRECRPPSPTSYQAIPTRVIL